MADAPMVVAVGELSDEEIAQVKGVVYRLMPIIAEIADRVGWPIIFSALPTILTPLLLTGYGEAETAAIYRRLADQVPQLAQGWSGYFADRALARRPAEGHA